MLLALVGYVALTSSAAASGRPELPAAREFGQIGQYHGTWARQYHGIAATFGRLSAWQGASWGSNAKFSAPIAKRVISPLFDFHSGISRTKLQKPVASRSADRIAVRNDRSIGAQIGSGTETESRNPRLMLQLGGVFGLVYVAFLAVWFWATRFRMRPPTSAAPRPRR